MGRRVLERNSDVLMRDIQHIQRLRAALQIEGGELQEKACEEIDSLISTLRNLLTAKQAT